MRGCSGLGKQPVVDPLGADLDICIHKYNYPVLYIIQNTKHRETRDTVWNAKLTCTRLVHVKVNYDHQWYVHMCIVKRFYLCRYIMLTLC